MTRVLTGLLVLVVVQLEPSAGGRLDVAASSAQTVSEPERFPRPLSEEVLKRQISGFANDLCAECHDRPGGRESVPHLAGQQPAYIVAQLEAFRRASRAEPEASDCMWGLSSALSEDLVNALAGYFGSRPPRPGVPGDPAAVQAGRELFNRPGADGVASCAQCHGADAQGAGATPRLAGQSGAYLDRQLYMIRYRFRTSAVMHGVVRDLTDQDLYALAVYLQSL